MEKLQLIARFNIHPGKLEAFKAAAAECLAIVKEHDKDTLKYNWYLINDHTECVVHETYSHSSALLTHIQNLGEVFGKLMGTADFSAEIYGNPSEELMAAIAPMGPKVYTFLQGL